MKHLSIALTLVASSALGCVEVDDELGEEETSEAESSVLGGSVENATYPWVVHLSSGCGGTLIAPRWVLSAAHCWQSGPFPSVSFERKDPVTGAITNGTRSVDRAIPHPGYDPAHGQNDLLLLRLTSSFQYPTPNPGVAPIELGLGAPFPGQTGLYASHGHGSHTAGTVSVFRGTVEPSLLNDAYEFLATSATASGCPGDSGSGFVMAGGQKWFVTGVVSEAVGTGDCSKRIKMMDVHPYAPWIRSIVTELPAPAHDATADLLLRDTSGALAIQFMDGGTVTSTAAPSYYGSGQPVSHDWRVIATADFDGDGHKDILWRHTGGTLAIWTMNGGTMTSDHYPSYYSQGGVVGNDWQVAGVGDFDFDGTSDLVWRHTGSGAVAIWLIRDAEFYADRYPGSLGTSWAIQGVDDFNRNGVPDLLWRNTTTGEVQIWFMSYGGAGYGTIGWPGSPALGWTIQSTGDFNSDGYPDILWRDAGGALAIWLMRGTGTSHVDEYPPAVALSWTIQGTGDFDGDGSHDILWRHTSGTTAIWFMYGGLNFAQAYPALGASQSIVSVDDLD